MATVPVVVTEDASVNDQSVYDYSWTPMTTTNADGQPVGAVQFADRSFQVTGTFGAAGSLSIQGSNDGVNWATLNNAQGTAATFAAAGIRQMVEITRFIRPFITAGDGTTSLTVSAVLRRANPLRT